MNIYWHELWDEHKATDSKWNRNTILVSENPKINKLKAYLHADESRIIMHSGSTQISSVIANCGMVVISCDNPEQIYEACSVAKGMEYSVALYTLADFQEDNYEAKLKELGFRRWAYSRTLNTRSDNRITTYLLKLNDFKGEDYAI
jgi:hypothetical protein